MSTPVLISSSYVVPGYSLQPIQIGGDLYVFLITNGSPTLASVWKSTDSGSTWTEMDVANEPQIGGQPNACSDESTSLFVVSADPTVTYLQIVTYDFTTDKWGSPTVFTNEAIYGLCAYRASDSSVIVMGQILSYQPGPAYGRCGYSVIDTVGLTASANARCGGTDPASTQSWTAVGIVPLTSGNFLFVFEETPATTITGTYNIDLQSLSSSNTLGSMTTLDTTTGSVFALVYQPYSDGTNVIIAWQKDEGSNNITIWEAPTNSLTWQSQVISAKNSDVDTLAVCINGSTFILVVASNNGGTDSVDYALDTGSGFGLWQNIGNQTSSGMNLSALSLFEFGLVTQSSAYWWGLSVSPPAPAPGVFIIDGSGLMFGNLPGGSLCQFARPQRCGGHPPRPLQPGKEVTFPRRSYGTVR